MPHLCHASFPSAHRARELRLSTKSKSHQYTHIRLHIVYLTVSSQSTQFHHNPCIPSPSSALPDYQQRSSSERHTRGSRGASSCSSDGQSEGSTAGRKRKEGGRGGSGGSGRHAHAPRDRTGGIRGADGKDEGALLESKNAEERRSQEQRKSAPNVASMHFSPLPTDSGASRTNLDPGIANVSPDSKADITKVSPGISHSSAGADMEADPGE